METAQLYIVKKIFNPYVSIYRTFIIVEKWTLVFRLFSHLSWRLRKFQLDCSSLNIQITGWMSSQQVCL